MRIWTVTKRTLIIIFCIFLAIGVIIGTAFGKVKKTSAIAKKLPIYAVETNEMKIAITFDVAWGNEDIDEILSVLKRHNAKSTFFIVGDWVSQNPTFVKKIFDEGHLIGNHSDTHKAFSKCNKAEIKEEITSCNEKIQKITNEDVAFLRAPSGDYTNDSIDIAKSLNMHMIQWDIDTLDTKVKYLL